MEGVLHVEGPALNWRANKAELRIPRLQLGPAPGGGIAARGAYVDEFRDRWWCASPIQYSLWKARTWWGAAPISTSRDAC